MSACVEAIYEAGHLRLLQALSLPEHSRVRVVVETLPMDEERSEWLAQSERTLHKAWDNDADAVYDALLKE